MPALLIEFFQTVSSIYDEVCLPESFFQANNTSMSFVQPSDIPGPLVSKSPENGEPGEVLLSTPPAAKAVTSPSPVEKCLSTLCAIENARLRLSS